MKKLHILILLCFFSYYCYAQQALPKIDLDISDVEWVFVKFPAAISYADFGTDDIQAEKTALSNIIRIKSAIPNFTETSITVVTADGKLRTFALHYNQTPKYLAIDMKNVGNAITDASAIPPLKIEISDDRTSHIIAPEKIVDISVGIDSFAAENAENTSNIIKVRQTGPFDSFEQTSLTLLSENGNLYPFVVTHNENPQELNISIGNSSASAIFSESSMNEEDMKKFAEEVLKKGMRISNIGTVQDKMTFCLSSLYIHDNVLMFHLYAHNDTKIDYSIDFIKTYVKNLKTTTSSADQYIEQTPLYVYSPQNTDDGENQIKANSDYDAVFFFPKFTVPNKHYLFFELFEKNGGRHVTFKMSNKEILKAEYIK